MYHRSKSLFCIVLWVLAGGGSSVLRADTHGQVCVSVGQAFTIDLAANPSTGYSWTLAQSLPSWLVQVGKAYTAANPGLIGGGGTESWQFRATAAGNATLIFQYERPWEGTPIQVHACRITVPPDPSSPPDPNRP